MTLPILFQKPNQILVYFMLRASTDWTPAACWKWSATGVGNDWLTLCCSLAGLPTFNVLKALDYAGRPR